MYPCRAMFPSYFSVGGQEEPYGEGGGTTFGLLHTSMAVAGCGGTLGARLPLVASPPTAGVFGFALFEVAGPGVGSVAGDLVVRC